MSDYSDLYIEFAAEYGASDEQAGNNRREGDINCVVGDYNRDGIFARRERYFSYEFLSALETGKNKIDAVGLIKDSFSTLLAGNEKVLLVGLGNYHFTADALGRAVLDSVIKVDNVYKLYPQCRGVTGIESTDLLRASIKLIKPDAVVIVDSLATRNLSRLGRVIQLTDSAITPGGGINSGGKTISSREFGLPIIAIGAPLIIKATSINEKASCDNNRLLTSAAIDEQITDIAAVISESINACFK